LPASLRGFVAEGAKVVIADVLEPEGGRSAGELGKQAILSDSTSRATTDWAATWRRREGLRTRSRLLVNKTRPSCASDRHRGETDPAAWRQVIDINLTGKFRGFAQLWP